MLNSRLHLYETIYRSSIQINYTQCRPQTYLLDLRCQSQMQQCLQHCGNQSTHEVHFGCTGWWWDTGECWTWCTGLDVVCSQYFLRIKSVIQPLFMWFTVAVRSCLFTFTNTTNFITFFSLWIFNFFNFLCKIIQLIIFLNTANIYLHSLNM